MSDSGSPAPARRESTYGEVVDARRVIAKLHTLAADPRNRPFIARDAGCLRNIIRTFDFPADDVVYKALETLSYLSSHSQENRQLLSQQPGLMPRLHEIGEMHPEEEVADLAKHLHQQLSSDKSVENPTTPEKALNRPALAMLASSKLDLLRTQASPATKNMHSRQPRTIMFKVEGLTGEEDKDKLERAIIRTKGVISVSLDNFELGDSSIMRILAQRQLSVRAVVRAKCPPEDIIAACERNDLNACIYDPTKDLQREKPERTPTKDGVMSGYETPLSERSTQHGASEGGGDSPRYLTPPDLNACGDRVLVSMEDKTIGVAVEKPKDDGISWIQKVGRVLWW